MSAHPPPVPPEQQPRHGTPTPHDGNEAKPPQDPNLAEQGRQGAIKQNTTNRGLQQDR
jgi:hypothetical protein